MKKKTDYKLIQVKLIETMPRRGEVCNERYKNNIRVESRRENAGYLIVMISGR